MVAKKPEEIANFLENHNKWRRGNDNIDPPDPVALGEIIEDAVSYLRRIDNDR